MNREKDSRAENHNVKNYCQLRFNKNEKNVVLEMTMLFTWKM